MCYNNGKLDAFYYCVLDVFIKSCYSSIQRKKQNLEEVPQLQQFIKRSLTDPVTSGHVGIAPQQTDLSLIISGISGFLSFLYPHQINHFFRKRLCTSSFCKTTLIAFKIVLAAMKQTAM